MKRILDILISLFGLIVSSPVTVPVMLLVWLQDFYSPFYIAPRVGKNGNLFRMVKLRSMVVKADSSGVDSTSSSDPRTTLVGMFIRKYKLDELSQLWNVLAGDMSLVGPRPNVERETNLYTQEEKRLLEVKPGITDLSSIVFSDEGEILKDSKDPDLTYNQLIRPWKSRLGLLYLDNQTIFLDFRIIILTIISIFSRHAALSGVKNLLTKLTADEKLLRIVERKECLTPYPPPGSNQIVTER